MKLVDNKKITISPHKEKGGRLENNTKEARLTFCRIKSNLNIKEFLRSSPHVNPAILMESLGYTANFSRNEREYKVIIQIDEVRNSISMKVYPHIHCVKAAQGPVCIFLNNINTALVGTFMGVDENRNIYISKQCSIDATAISVHDLKKAEDNLISQIHPHIPQLEKIIYSHKNPNTFNDDAWDDEWGNIIG